MVDPRTTKILNHLREQGYAANVDEDGEIAFKCNRLSMLLRTEDQDTEFYNVSVYSALDPHQVTSARHACEACL